MRWVQKVKTPLSINYHLALHWRLLIFFREINYSFGCRKELLSWHLHSLFFILFSFKFLKCHGEKPTSKLCRWNPFSPLELLKHTFFFEWLANILSSRILYWIIAMSIESTIDTLKNSFVASIIHFSPKLINVGTMSEDFSSLYTSHYNWTFGFD